jgi:flagellar biosynthesis protein FlhB
LQPARAARKGLYALTTNQHPKRRQNLRTKKHKGVLLSASVKSSKIEPNRPRVFKEDSFSVRTAPESSRSILGIAIISLSFVFVTSIWLIDISVGSMLSGSNVGLSGISDPILTYHIGLVVAILSCFTIVVIAAIKIIRG